MKIKDRYKIGPFFYDIIKTSLLQEIGDEVDAGLSLKNTLKIFLDTQQAPENQLSVLLHEVIEQFNDIYDIQLDHHQVTLLEVALYQFLVENNLLAD